MLRKRLIAVLTFNNGVLFRTKHFHPDYRYTLNFVDAWSIDEIIMLDVTRPGIGDRNNFLEVINTLAQKCFVPLTIGGGIRSVADVSLFLNAGADKVSINTGAINNPSLISEISSRYGVQCIVVSIDTKIGTDGKYLVMSDAGSTNTGMEVTEWAKQAEFMGAGELLINTVERDGSLEGLDLKLCQNICAAVTIPVLALGGVGNWQHIVEGFREGGVDGVCTQNIFHFTEASIRSAKSFLKQHKIAVR